jgi:hypothetical protein
MRLEATPVGSLLRKNALHQMGQNSRRDCGNQDMVARRALGGGPSAAVEPPNGSSGAEGMFVSTPGQGFGGLFRCWGRVAGDNAGDDLVRFCRFVR